MHFDVYEELIYASNFLIEAFISVRTVYSEASSRACKTFSLLFEKKPVLMIKGVGIAVDFLEAQRVGFRSQRESNFLIFYYIFAGDKLKGISGRRAETFEALKGDMLPELIPDKDYRKAVFEALQMVGASKEMIEGLMELLMGIVLLGEGETEKGNREIEELLGVKGGKGFGGRMERNLMMVWLYKKCFKWVVGKIKAAFFTQVNNGKSVAENEGFFNNILEESVKASLLLEANSSSNNNNSNNSNSNNQNTMNSSKVNNNANNNYGFLHLIDPCGVKSRALLRGQLDQQQINNFSSYFEFQANFLYEKLHQIYLKDCFKDEEVCFLQEGLTKHCDFIDFKDNLAVIELVEKPIFGVFRYFLDQIKAKIEKKAGFDEKALEEIMARDSNDVFFTGKMTKKPNTFVIIHSFNEVYYSQDLISTDFDRALSRKTTVDSFKKTLLSCSSNKLLSTFTSEEAPVGVKWSGGNFVEKFQIRIEKLINSINSCEKRFIFCINCESPSQLKKPCFEALSCLTQSQVFEFENLISRFKEEFPIKIDFPRFYQEFKELLGTASEVFMKEKVLDMKHLCEKIVLSQFPEALNSKVLMGKTKIYLKSEVYSKFQAKRALAMNRPSAAAKEKFFSTPEFKIGLKLSIHGLKQVMKVIIEFQKRFKAKLVRRKFLRKKKALSQIFNVHDRLLTKKYFKRYRNQVVSLNLKNQKLKKLIKMIQINKNSFIRGYFNRYRETILFEKTYFSKKVANNNESPSFKQRVSKVFQAEAILRQIERQKTIDSKKNSLILTQPPVQREELSLGKLLKNKLLKSLENKSIFNRLTKKKTNESPLSSFKDSTFGLDESTSFEPNNMQLLEESKTIAEKSEFEEMLNSEDRDRKRRKCVTAKNFQEYENKSTKSLLEEYLEYRVKKEPLSLEFDQVPLSNDIYLAFELMDARFIEELKKEYFEETWRKMVNERTVWGQKQKYTKLMSYQAKMLDGPLLELPNKIKDLAKRMFKYVLQYGEDRKTKFAKPVQLNKLIVLLMDENNCSFLQDEIYLQILKQLSNNPNQTSIHNLMNLLAIISSLIPPSSSLVMSVLNFLFLKASLNVTFNEDLAKKCKYIFIRVSKIFEIGARKHIPMDSEIACIESSKQIMHPVYFLTGEHVLLGCESYTLVREMRLNIANRFKLYLNRAANLGIYFFVKAEKENSFSTEEEGFLEDKNKIMDVLARWENLKKVNKNSDFSFYSRIFLKIRACFDYEETNSNDDITLVYIQSVHEFLNDKYSLNEKELLSLAASKMAVDYGDFSEEKVRFLKINIQDYIPRSKLENYQPQIWIDHILVHYLTLKTYGKTQAKIMFLSQLKKFEHFNANVYKGKLFISEEVATNSEGVFKIIIWKSNGIAIGDDLNRIAERFKYSDIGKWGKINKKGVYFTKSIDEKKIYNFFSEKYKELEFLLKFYAKHKFNDISQF